MRLSFYRENRLRIIFSVSSLLILILLSVSPLKISVPLGTGFSGGENCPVVQRATTWPKIKSLTLNDAGLDEHFNHLRRHWVPTLEANTYDNAYHHMLEIRSAQPKGLVHGHVGFFPMQAFKYFWVARGLAVANDIRSKPPPVMCEIGFGTGMSSAILLTATSSRETTKVGSPYYLFDCGSCDGDAKNESLEYLSGVFPGRIRRLDGLSEETIPKFSKDYPNIKCDFVSIDGSHEYPAVLNDIKAASKIAHAEQTVLLFDDYQNVNVKKSVDEAVEQKVIAIEEIFTADYHLDLTMSSIREQTVYKKLFVKAAFL